MSEKEYTIFKDRNKLEPRYIPRNLVHREKQLNQLHNIFGDSLRNLGETVLQVVRVVGPIGSGKTCTVTWFTRELMNTADKLEAPLSAVHINCNNMARSPRNLYRLIYKKATGEKRQSLSREEYLVRLINYLRENERFIFIILDDIDYLLANLKGDFKEGGIVYDLTRLNEHYPGMPDHVVGLILVGREGLTDYIAPCEKSSLGLLKIKLPGYDRTQLREILENRIHQAFHENCVPEHVLDYVADLSAYRDSDPGDCRFALDLLMFAGRKAHDTWSKYVTLEHVRAAYSVNLQGPSVEDFRHLDSHMVLVIWSTIYALEGTRDKAYTSQQAVYDYYYAECIAKGLKPYSIGKVREILRELDMMNIITVSGKGVAIEATSLEELKEKLEILEKTRKI